MGQDLATHIINKLANEQSKISFDFEPEVLLKEYLKEVEGEETNPPLPELEAQDKSQVKDLFNDDSALTPETLSPEFNTEDSGKASDDEYKVGTLEKKVIELKEIMAQFNDNEDIDLNILNPLLPYRTSLKPTDSGEGTEHARESTNKIEEYDSLVKHISEKAKILMSDETFNKDTKLESIKNAKPANKFLTNLVASSIAELYPREMVDTVLNRPEGLTIVLMSKEEGKGAVGLYSGKENYILADGTSVMLGMLNLKEPKDTHNRTEGDRHDHEVSTEQLDVIKHEFLHALDAKDYGEGKYLADARLPGMTDEQANIIVDAYNSLKEAGNSGRVHKYSLTNKEEFIATAIETFIDNPSALKDGGPKLAAVYDVFKDTFKRDPIAYMSSIEAA